VLSYRRMSLEFWAVFVSGIAVIVSIVTLLLVMSQTKLMGRQTVLMERQGEIIEKQDEILGRRHELELAFRPIPSAANTHVMEVYAINHGTRTAHDFSWTLWIVHDDVRVRDVRNHLKHSVVPWVVEKIEGVDYGRYTAYLR